MNKIDRLQATVNRAFGDDTTILRCDDRYILVRYSKGGSVEFATLRHHNFNSMTGGHYFTAWSVAVDDYNNKDYKIARDNAIADYNNRI